MCSNYWYFIERKLSSAFPVPRTRNWAAQPTLLSIAVCWDWLWNLASHWQDSFFHVLQINKSGSLFGNRTRQPWHPFPQSSFPDCHGNAGRQARQGRGWDCLSEPGPGCHVGLVVHGLKLREPVGDHRGVHSSLCQGISASVN